MFQRTVDFLSNKFEMLNEEKNLTILKAEVLSHKGQMPNTGNNRKQDFSPLTQECREKSS